MFCSNCGLEISSFEKNCPHCSFQAQGVTNGGAVPTESPHTRKKEPINTLFNRDVLKIYLNNLQTLEFAKNRLVKDKHNVECKANSLCIPDEIRATYSLFDCCRYIGGFTVAVSFFLLCIWIVRGTGGNGFRSYFFDALIAVMIVAIFSVVVLMGYIVSRSSYKRGIREDATRLEIEREEQTDCLNTLQRIKHDLKEITTLLDETYAVNIIPHEYRNLSTVHFLYQHIITSEASLKDALAHADLIKISKKLDFVTEQEQKIITSVARFNALDKGVVSQNEQLIQHAIETENNPALAAKYAQISAVNAKTVAQIKDCCFI